MVGSFETSVDAWERWYRANEPESSELPGEWEAKCNELQRMVLIRCLRYTHPSGLCLQTS